MLTDAHRLDTDSLIRVGGQLGSNPAGLYQDADGRRYYIKSLESRDHARNERLAAGLYALAGAPTLPYVATRDPLQIATVWLALDKCGLSQFSDDERRQAQAWFGVHAWTANWDAAGLLGDNQGVWQGRVLTLDVGGPWRFAPAGIPRAAPSAMWSTSWCGCAATRTIPRPCACLATWTPPRCIRRSS